MLGNVWEWCEDHYGKDAYTKYKEKNPVYQEIENEMDYRVICGGSWLSEPDSIRCAKRTPAHPESRFNVLGFRLVVEVKRQDDKKMDAFFRHIYKKMSSQGSPTVRTP